MFNQCSLYLQIQLEEQSKQISEISKFDTTSEQQYSKIFWIFVFYIALNFLSDPLHIYLSSYTENISSKYKMAFDLRAAEKKIGCQYNMNEECEVQPDYLPKYYDDSDSEDDESKEEDEGEEEKPNIYIKKFKKKVNKIPMYNTSEISEMESCLR
jgi:hypothetical protein